MREYKDIWIRVAVVKKHDPTDPNPPLWRFFLDRQDPDIQLNGWDLTGQAVPGKNHIPVANPKPDKESVGITGLKAAIDVFGDLVIDENNIAHITLKNPA